MSPNSISTPNPATLFKVLIRLSAMEPWAVHILTRAMYSVTDHLNYIADRRRNGSSVEGWERVREKR